MKFNLHLKRLNQAGVVHHIIIPLLVVGVVAAVGVRVLTRSHADAPITSLCANQTLQSDQILFSPSYNFGLVMQPDGNLVLHRYNYVVGDQAMDIPTPNIPKTSGSGNYLLVTSGGGMLINRGNANVANITPDPGYNLVPGSCLRVGNNGGLDLYAPNGTVTWDGETGGISLPNFYNYFAGSPSIDHDSGALCYSSQPDSGGDWCSKAQSGGSLNPMWFGPYLTQPGPLYNFSVQLSYHWTTSVGTALKPIEPAPGDSFTFDVTDESGKVTLAKETVSGTGGGPNQQCSPLTYDPEAGCFVQINLNAEPIAALEGRVYNVSAPNANGDVLHLSELSIYSQANL